MTNESSVYSSMVSKLPIIKCTDIETLYTPLNSYSNDANMYYEMSSLNSDTNQDTTNSKNCMSYFCNCFDN